MSIKIKNRDPKSTDFSPNDIIVNVKDGTLFYKSDKALFKLQGDNLNTPTTENSFESSINITAFSGSFQYITASVIDVDAETIRFGGTSLARTDVQNLKTGLFNHITASGNISASGTGQFGDDITITSGSFHVETFNEGIKFFNGTNYTANKINITTAQNMQFRAGGVMQFVPTTEILGGAQIIFKNADNTDRIQVHNGAGSGAGKARLDFEDSSNNVKMSISSSGNVGIGTTTPGEKLEVAGKAIIRKSGTATAHGDTDLFVTDATAALSHATIQILGGNAGASNIQFSDTDAYSQGAILYNHSTDTMAIKAGASTAITITGSNQNVGIGTSSPGEKLEVVGNISASGLLFASSSEGNYSDIVVQDITTGRFYTTSSVALSTTLPSGILSSSAQIATDISGAIDTATGSLSASIVSNYLLNTTDTLTGDLTVTGTITAQEFHTEFVSASIIFSSGSTQFGNSSDDIATFSGSINVKDPGNISTTGIISGSGRLFANLTPGTENNLVYYNTVSGELKRVQLLVLLTQQCLLKQFQVHLQVQVKI